MLASAPAIQTHAVLEVSAVFAVVVRSGHSKQAQVPTVSLYHPTLQAVHTPVVVPVYPIAHVQLSALVAPSASVVVP